MNNNKQCPFCHVEMYRPRKSVWGNEDEPLINLSCSQFRTKDDGHQCPHCKSYNDWECPQCGILLFYRS